ncbi:MAG: uroporphyrinogen decarboxylase family protein, partial [bacterium]
SEAFKFQEEGCTLVQHEYLFKDFDEEYLAWKSLFEDREFEFDLKSYQELSRRVGEDGLVIAGEVTCPLKQLHILARSDITAYLLYDHESEMIELMEIYAEKALRLIGKMVAAGVKAVMTMDNLDSTFYPPPHFKRYCAAFFSRAAEICHGRGAVFFSHACGQQRSILPLVTECGIDGLEGIAFPPLGDVDLWEAREAGDRFIVEGGLSAAQLEGYVSREDAEAYVSKLFNKLKPFDRFIFSMSCNTSIKTSWDTLRRYRDAWLKFSGGD